jgi:predicted Rossmann fold nucleotide-binding protein DprA/Smf involved in DNA uptake
MKKLILITLILGSLYADGCNGLMRDNYELLKENKELKEELAYYKQQYPKDKYVKDGQKMVEDAKEKSYWFIGKSKEKIVEAYETGKNIYEAYKEKQ